jgi:hypothetical protein
MQVRNHGGICVRRSRGRIPVVSKVEGVYRPMKRNGERLGKGGPVPFRASVACQREGSKGKEESTYSKPWAITRGPLVVLPDGEGYTSYSSSAGVTEDVDASLPFP